MTDSVCEDVLLVLRQILRAIAVQSRHLSHSYGITTPQLLAMKVLERLGAISIGGLSREMSLSQATVTAIVDRLEKKGYVGRSRSTVDRRRVEVALTEQGRRVLAAAPSPIQESFSRAFEGLADWEQTLILSSLQRMAVMMKADDLPSQPLFIEEPQI